LGRTEEESGVTVILFTTIAPHALTEELSRQGCRVTEALAVSEVLSLAERHPLATIIIIADVDRERAKAVQHHYPTLHLKPAATGREIVWELSHARNGSVQ
jgi:hypothetical protein